MSAKKKIFASLLVLLLILVSVQVGFAQTNTLLLKKGMSGPEVSKLQKDLNILGFLSVNPTGYFGNTTKDSVIGFQKRYNLKVDGIAGKQTLSQANKLLNQAPASSSVSVKASFAQTNTSFLKEGMSGPEVLKFQKDLKTLGFLNVSPTGYFGKITKLSVINFQKRYNLRVDGIAGKQTLSQASKLLNQTSQQNRPVKKTTSISRGTVVKRVSMLDWFKSVNKIFSIGKVATVTDVDTGLKVKVKRTYGTNHADVETLTANDTRTLKKIAGGTWNWTRRAVIVEVDGYRIAASITAMPHAGRDDKPANVTVSNRAGGYGTGINLDAVKGNNMDGHFDIHFLDSRTHGTNRVDQKHQEMIKKAYNSGL